MWLILNIFKMLIIAGERLITTRTVFLEHSHAEQKRILKKGWAFKTLFHLCWHHGLMLQYQLFLVNSRIQKRICK